MFRFLLVVLLLGAIGLALTNPTTDDVRAQVNARMAAPAGGAAGDIQTPGGQPGLPQAVTSALSDKLQGEVQIERTNYYLFSVYKVSLGGQGAGTPVPGCLIGIAKQAVPYDKC